ncbi:metallophosphoesterase [Enterococcus asini]|uniref:metallophosphoesterase n=1 Tax=Enterococcus asini TaxID=57732 RepID=UPI002891CAA7|nr:metallophosphoesterase [Enterococcus asini]MDT2757175.1 metallophosphoesterase [Enterococcus asini]
MSRLAIISDLHVDINGFFEKELSVLATVLRENGVNQLHLAGDIANKVTRALEVVTFFEAAGFPTSFNWGNHEMADLEEEEIENYHNPAFLNFQERPLTKNKVILGYNGWYDYLFAIDYDLKKIAKLKQLYWYDRMITRSHSDPFVDADLCQRLKQVLDRLQVEGKEVILATHFVPKKEFIVYQTDPKYQRWNELNAFLGSGELGELLDRYENLSHCVFGHTHRRFSDLTIGKTVYSCRPFGYYFEWELTREFVFINQLVTEYAPMKLRGILRRYQEEFEKYKQEHLATEFRRGMTIIDY